MGRRAAVKVRGGRPALGCDDQPEHPPDRTLRLDRRPSGAPPPCWPPAEADRRRAPHPGRGAGPAGNRLRGPLAAADPRATARRLSVSAGPVRLQQRLRGALPLLRRLIRTLAADTDLWSDPVWLVDSTPVECARSRPAVQRSDLAGIAGYGYCASHSRYFWGLRLHLVCTPAGLPLPLGAGPSQAG